MQGLWVAAAAIAASAFALSVFGGAHRRDHGWGWWLGALWAVAVALAFAPAAPASRVLAAAVELLLLLWPLANLLGVRRFHGRLQLPGSAPLDLLAGAAAVSVLLTGTFWSPDSGPGALAPAAASLAMHLYAASVLFASPADRDAGSLRGWGALLAANAAAPVAWALGQSWLAGGGDGVPALAARAFSTSLSAIAAAFLILTLVHQRTERQLRDSRRRLRWLANIDALTHVPNRRHFGELAQRALAIDPHGSAALVLFDVDHFKRVNDDHGHAAGDRALRLVARCVQDVLRADDVPGRHGGDEFVLLLRRASTDEAIAVAQRIVTRVQKLALAAGLPAISLSFGIVHCRRSETLDDALRRADQALYEAKRQGRSRAVTQTGDEQHPVFADSRRLGLHAA